MNLLFDLDGTLADPFDAIAGSLDFAFDALGLPRLSRETVGTLIGPPLQQTLPAVLGDRADQADEAFRLYREHHARTGIYHYKFYAGMDDALHWIQGRHRIFLATSKPKIYADEILRHFGRAAPFEATYGAELNGVRSKKGDLIAYAMSESRLGPDDTIMIGDREHDTIGALANGIRSFGVTWGYGSRAELQSAGAHRIVTSWPELLAAID